MKIIKLDNRYKCYKQGFTHAISFTFFTEDAINIERYLYNKYGHSSTRGQWYAWFGKRCNYRRPFYIAVRHESIITMILLSVDHTAQQ